jgi:hypothetical protein
LNRNLYSFRGVFHQNNLKLVPIKSKVDCTKSGMAFIFLQAMLPF